MEKVEQSHQLHHFEARWRFIGKWLKLMSEPHAHLQLFNSYGSILSTIVAVKNCGKWGVKNNCMFLDISSRRWLRQKAINRSICLFILYNTNIYIYLERAPFLLLSFFTFFSPWVISYSLLLYIGVKILLVFCCNIVLLIVIIFCSSFLVDVSFISRTT